jgi:hypothetical protein
MRYGRCRCLKTLRLNGSAADQKVVEQNNQSEHEQNVDQATADIRH